MVCSANQSGRSKTAVWVVHWHSQQPLLSSRLCQAFYSSEADLVFRRLPPACRPEICRSVCMTGRPALVLLKKFSPLKRR